jgi:Peptidase A4 family
MKWSTTAFSFAIVGLMLGVPAALASAPIATAHAVPFFAVHGGPVQMTSSVSSTNWAGYAVTGAKGSVSSVVGSWTEPAATCSSSGAQYAAFWVGIDGYSSTTVEQTGTEADCSHGTASYYAWFEFYPSPSRLVSAVPIHAGDVISASVTYSTTTAKFTLTLKDVTTGKSFTKTGAVKSAKRTSAEWIAEAPYSGGILPLTDFGTFNFGYDNTSVSGTNDATVSGTTGDLGSFSTAVAINMVEVSNSSVTKASTSAISTDGTSFSVTWLAAGP